MSTADDHHIQKAIQGRHRLTRSSQDVLDGLILEFIRDRHRFLRSSRDALNEWIQEHADLVGVDICADYTRNVYWYDDQCETHRLTGHCVDLGRLAIVWTCCEEAGTDNIAVIETDDPDPSEVARKHAAGIASSKEQK